MAFTADQVSSTQSVAGRASSGARALTQLTHRPVDPERRGVVRVLHCQLNRPLLFKQSGTGAYGKPTNHRDPRDKEIDPKRKNKEMITVEATVKLR